MFPFCIQPLLIPLSCGCSPDVSMHAMTAAGATATSAPSWPAAATRSAATPATPAASGARRTCSSIWAVSRGGQVWGRGRRAAAKAWAIALRRRADYAWKHNGWWIGGNHRKQLCCLNKKRSKGKNNGEMKQKKTK